MPIYKADMKAVENRRAQIMRQKEEREANANFDEFVEGPNYRRILPPWSAEGKIFKRAFYHYGIKAQGSIVCPNKTFGQPCPVCPEVEKLFKMRHDPEAQQLAKDLRAKERCFANVLNYNKNDNKVWIMAFGPKLEEALTNMMYGGVSPDGKSVFGCGDVSDLQNGRMIMISKKSNPKDKKLTDYTPTPDQTPSAVANGEAICAGLHNLDEVVNKDVFSYDQIVAMMNAKFNQGAAPAAAQGPATQTLPTTPATPTFQAPPQQQEQPRMTSEFVPPASSFPTPPPAAAPFAPPPTFAPPGFAAPPPFAPPPAFPQAGAPAPAGPSSALARLQAMGLASGQPQPPKA